MKTAICEFFEEWIISNSIQDDIFNVPHSCGGNYLHCEQNETRSWLLMANR